MWLLKFTSIFLWISVWGLVDILLNKFKLSDNQKGFVYIFGICITAYIISLYGNEDSGRGF
jgi:hypothetical protein